MSGKRVEIIKAHKTEENSPHRIKRVAAYCRVSTDEEEQLKSYNSQVKYFTAKIAENKNWELVEVYADAGISGVTSIKRPGFMQMIDDCMEGKIDLILTKSISRFSRNVIDTLENVRKLQKKNIAVIFEEEHINTLDMGNEFVLTILGSVHQQEIYNLSAHVKAGLKMKMKRGEMVGGFRTYGYNYDKITKQITVNEKEAEIVRQIFTWYADGVNLFEVCLRLEKQGVLTPKGKGTWDTRVLRGMLKNKKYIGVLEQGKTFVVDPLIRSRKRNFGEKAKFLVNDHHESIVSLELFNKAQELLSTRAKKHKNDQYKGKHKDNIPIYPFSKRIKCVYCGKHYIRSVHKGKDGREYLMWVNSCPKLNHKNRTCISPKSIRENDLRKLFVTSYNRIHKFNPKFLDEFIESLGAYLRAPQEKLHKQIKLLEEKQSNLLDSHLEGFVSVEEFNVKYKLLKQERDNLINELVSKRKEANVDKRLQIIKQIILQQPEMSEFNQEVFSSLVDEIIVGGYDEDGKPIDNKVTFVYKAGESDELRLSDFFNRESAPLQMKKVEQTSQNSVRQVEAVQETPKSSCSLCYSKPSDSCPKYKVNISCTFIKNALSSCANVASE